MAGEERRTGMGGYQRRISYLDYLENGMKIKNAGFVRIEENGGQIRMEIRVKNIPETISGQYEVKADTDEIIGRISLNRGNGSCCMVWQSGVHIPEGKKSIEANGVYIRLPGRHLIQTVWTEPMRLLAEEGQKAETKEAPDGHEKQPEIIVQAKPETLQEKKEVDILPIQNWDSKNWDNKTNLEQELQKPENENPKEPVCYGDKWEQLMHLYETVHPFGDGREYLSIAPKDFIVLREEYQKMVHNSFLLHGYYNYRHLILGRIGEKGNWKYYLGVPGNFYGREKMVAEMFGFEAFEGEKDPVSPGDFGYYMKRVEI